MVNEEEAPANANFSVQSGAFKIQVLTAGSAVNQIQLIYENLLIQNGKSYTLTFDARCTVARTIQVEASKGENPFDIYYSEVFNLTTTMSPFTMNFTMTQPTDEAGRICFDIGAYSGTVYIDNVVLLCNTPPVGTLIEYQTLESDMDEIWVYTWDAGNPTWSRTTEQAHSGSRSVKYTFDVANSSLIGLYNEFGTADLDVTAGGNNEILGVWIYDTIGANTLRVSLTDTTNFFIESIKRTRGLSRVLASIKEKNRNKKNGKPQYYSLYHFTQSIWNFAGNAVEAFGEPGQSPPTARLSSR